MKTGRKLTVLFLAVMLITVTLLAGCGGSKKDYSGLQQDVVKGSHVFVDDSDVVFFGYNNLLCTALFKDGTIYDYVVEAAFTGDVYMLAVYDGALYVSASDGIFKYDLDMFSGSGAASPEVLWDNHLSEYNPIQIYDGKLFFLYGSTLTYVPLEGGETVKLAMEAGDFEVTTDGVYYSKKDGSLHLAAIDGSEDKEVGEVAPAAYLSLDNGNIYFNENYTLRSLSLETGEVSDVETAKPLAEYCYPWAKDGAVLYQNIDSRVCVTGNEDASSDEVMVSYPFKYMGFKYKDWVVSEPSDYKELSVISFADGSFIKYDLASELASYLGEISGGGSVAAPTDSTPSGSFDILAGLQTQQDGSALYIYGNDFLLTMPNTDDWEYTQETKDSFTISMTEPRTEGYGGRLVTIKAFDLDDDSYTTLPSYSVAGVGRNVNKRFVAIFPTDVQYDPSNSGQAARYQELLAYVQKIGEGAVNSPFQTADSD